MHRPRVIVRPLAFAIFRMGTPHVPAPRSTSFGDIPLVVRKLIVLIAPVSAASGFFMIYVSVFLLQLGVTPETVGLVLAVNGAAMVLSAIPLGLLSDRKGRKWMLVLGALLFSPMLLVLALTTDTLWLVLVGILGGLSEAAFLSTWNAMIADGTPPAARNAAFSFSFIIGTTTSGIGLALPFVFPFLAAWTGQSVAALHHDALLAFAALAVISPVGVLLLRGYPEHVSRAPSRSAPLALRDRLRKVRSRASQLRLLLTFSGVNGLIGLGAGFIIPLIGTWFQLRFGIGDELSGPFLAATNVAMGLAGVTSTTLAARLGSIHAIVLVQGLSTVFMIALAFVPDPVLAAIVYVVRATLMNMASPIMDAYLMGLVSAEERGFASALNTLIWRMPNSASTVGGGWLLNQGQYRSPFLIAGGLYAVGVTLFYVLFRDVRPQDESAGTPRRDTA